MREDGKGVDQAEHSVRIGQWRVDVVDFERREIEKSLTPLDRFGVAVASVDFLRAATFQVSDHATAATSEVEQFPDLIEVLALPGHDVYHKPSPLLAPFQERIEVRSTDDHKSQGGAGDRRTVRVLHIRFDERGHIRKDDLVE